MSELLSLENLTIKSNTGNVLLYPTTLTISSYRTLGIVGESGSGKSLMAKAIIGLLPDTLQINGRILFRGLDLLKNDKNQWRKVRGKEIGLIVQNGIGAFDPLMPLKEQFIDILKYHTKMNTEACFQLACECLEKVNLNNPQQKLSLLPHQLSGGQLQRMMIAIALALKPSLIIADEPTTALDAITQAGILEQFQKLAKEQQSTLIFISHDLGIIRNIAHEIAVVYQGKIVEHQETESLWKTPKHGYTKFLLDTRERLSSRFSAITARE